MSRVLNATESGSFGMNLTIAGLRRQYSDVKNVDTETLDRWMRESATAPASQREPTDEPQPTIPQRKCVVLDVRPPEEFAVSCIPSALRVDPGEQDMNKLMQRIQETTGRTDTNQPLDVVMYCSLGYRSSALASRLQNFVDKKQDGPIADVAAYNLEGSIFKWANEGRQLVDLSGAETRFVHPYSKIWGLLLNKDRRRYSPL